jgi:alginate O-acetyltransferase complex protein AlgI
MLFNTQDFAIFFSVFIVGYWLCFKWRDVQNLVLLAGSGYFYYCFRHSLPVYLYTIIGLGYLSAILISRTDEKEKKKLTLICSVVLIGAGLTYTKYSGLLFGSIPGLSGWQASAMHIIVPIGISYFTFSSIGYITDVYRGTTTVEKNLITYAAYISYFPHILSGPIPSSANILPQFAKTKKFPSFSQIERSAGEIIWGTFKKMVVADNMVLTVNYCFEHYNYLNGFTLFLGVMSFNLYLYADFSGYSDIAMAISRLMGIELVRNFQMPFFSRNPAEYWRRWHTSLNKWMTNYIYLPFGGNQNHKGQYILLLLFIFSFSGLWHGANYNFICWGLVNGIYFIPYVLAGTLIRYKTVASPGRILPTLSDFGKILLTFVLTTLTRIFFRSPDFTVAMALSRKIFSTDLFHLPSPIVARNLWWFLPILLLEWVQREKTYFLEIRTNKIYLRFFLYAIIIFATWIFFPRRDLIEYYYFKF